LLVIAVILVATGMVGAGVQVVAALASRVEPTLAVAAVFALRRDRRVNWSVRMRRSPRGVKKLAIHRLFGALSAR
jgi:hypothetical protein